MSRTSTTLADQIINNPVMYYSGRLKPSKTRLTLITRQIDVLLSRILIDNQVLKALQNFIKSIMELKSPTLTRQYRYTRAQDYLREICTRTISGMDARNPELRWLLHDPLFAKNLAKIAPEGPFRKSISNGALSVVYAIIDGGLVLGVLWLAKRDLYDSILSKCMESPPITAAVSLSILLTIAITTTLINYLIIKRHHNEALTHFQKEPLLCIPFASSTSDNTNTHSIIDATMLSPNPPALPTAECVDCTPVDTQTPDSNRNPPFFIEAEISNPQHGAYP